MKPKSFKIICGITLCFAVSFQLFVLNSCTTGGGAATTGDDSIEVVNSRDLNRILQRAR